MSRSRVFPSFYVLAMLLLTADPLTAASGAARKVMEGNDRYLEGDLEGALGRYTDAQVDLPDSPVLHYNIGNVLFRQGDYAKAVDEYRLAELSEEPDLRRSARFNIGNAHFLSQEFERAVEDYMQVLRENPDDSDAKRNLELALEALRQEEQQQEEESSDSEQSDDDQSEEKEQQQEQSQQDSDESEQEQEDQQQPEDDSSQDEQQGSPPPSEPQEESSSESDPSQNPASPQPQEPTLPEQEAARILDALKQEEKENMKRALRAPRTGRGTGKDW